MNLTLSAKKTAANAWSKQMHLRNSQVQKVIHALRQTGHLVVIRKPGEIEGASYAEVRDAVEKAIDQVKVAE